MDEARDIIAENTKKAQGLDTKAAGQVKADEVIVGFDAFALWCRCNLAFQLVASFDVVGAGPRPFLEVQVVGATL